MLVVLLLTSGLPFVADAAVDTARGVPAVEEKALLALTRKVSAITTPATSATRCMGHPLMFSSCPFILDGRCRERSVSRNVVVRLSF